MLVAMFFIGGCIGVTIAVAILIASGSLIMVLERWVEMSTDELIIRDAVYTAIHQMTDMCVSVFDAQNADEVKAILYDIDEVWSTTIVGDNPIECSIGDDVNGCEYRLKVYRKEVKRT